MSKRFGFKIQACNACHTA